MRTLAELRPMESGIIRTLRGAGGIQQRLLEMGLIDGTKVEVLRYAPLGDPIEIFVRGFHLTLRKSEAQLVEVDA